MPEILTYGPAFLEDLARGFGRREVTLQNDEKRLLTEINLGGLVEAYTLATLRNAGYPGTVARLTDAYGGVLWDTGVQWAYVGQRMLNVTHPPFNLRADKTSTYAASNAVGAQRALDTALTYNIPLYWPGANAPYRIGGNLYWGNSAAHNNGLLGGLQSGNLRMYGDGSYDYLSASGYAVGNTAQGQTILYFEDGYHFVFDGSASNNQHVRNVKLSDMTIIAGIAADYVLDFHDNSEVRLRDLTVLQRDGTGHLLGIRAIVDGKSINFVDVEYCTFNNLVEDTTGALGSRCLTVQPRLLGGDSSGSDLTFRQCKFRNCGTAIDLGLAGTANELRDVRFLQCWVQRGYNGILVRDGIKNLVLDDMHIERQSGTYGINLEGDIQAVRIMGGHIGMGSMAASAKAIQADDNAKAVTIMGMACLNIQTGMTGIQRIPGTFNVSTVLVNNVLDGEAASTGNTGIDLGTGAQNGLTLGPNYFTGTLATEVAGDHRYNVRWAKNFTEFGLSVMFNLSATTVASAGSITLPNDGNAFLLSGSTTINTIATTNTLGNSYRNGTVIWLVNPNGGSAITIGHGTGNIYFRAGANYTFGTRQALAFLFYADTWICLGVDTAASKQTVTGSRGGNAALASLLTGLAAMGLITDSTSA